MPDLLVTLVRDPRYLNPDTATDLSIILCIVGLVVSLCAGIYVCFFEGPLERRRNQRLLKARPGKEHFDWDTHRWVK